MSAEDVQADAAALVTMTVADLVAHLDGVDLETLTTALALEQAGGARKGAVAAIEAAIAGHPENAAAAAQAAESADDTAADEPVITPAPDAPADLPPAAEDGEQQDEPAAGEPLGTINTIAEPLQDAPADPDAVSAAPPRPHASIVAQLELRWIELKEFVRTLEGEVEGELGEALAFIRSKL